MSTTRIHPFTGARRARPTLKHRPAIWENMLGTVYASDGTETRYFDYDWAAAREFAGLNGPGNLDPRLCRPRVARRSTGSGPEAPRPGQMVLWVLR